MAAIRQDFILWRGTTQTVEFSVIDDNGNAVDITSWTGALTLRLHSSDADPAAFSKAGAIYGSPGNGKFRVPITKAESLTVAAGRYQHTFERTNAGSEDVCAFGIATVRLDLVNAP